MTRLTPGATSEGAVTPPAVGDVGMAVDTADAAAVDDMAFAPAATALAPPH